MGSVGIDADAAARQERPSTTMSEALRRLHHLPLLPRVASTTSASRSRGLSVVGDLGLLSMRFQHGSPGVAAQGKALSATRMSETRSLGRSSARDSENWLFIENLVTCFINNKYAETTT